MNERFPCCDHIALFSRDPDALVSFYVEKVGFKKEKDEILAKNLAREIWGVNDDFRFIRLGLGELKIEIFGPVSVPLQERNERTAGLNHWGLCVSDRYEFCQQLREQGVEIVEIRRPTHVVYFVRDPEGNLIEVRDKQGK